MRTVLRSLVASLGTSLPDFAIRHLLQTTLGTDGVALCLHRVCGKRRAGERMPALTIPEETLDSLITLLLSSRSPSSPRWLSVTFDDGYEDAALYVESRAARFPEVEWLFFVCPEKTEGQVGFRWDFAERRNLAGQPDPPPAPVDLTVENQRPELRETAQQSDYRLADVTLCRALQALPNVALGNHTNVHFQQTRLTLEQSLSEYRKSTEIFERLFGAPKHFAFPFGTPEHDFKAAHVHQLRAVGAFLIWTTEGRPYSLEDRHIPGAVLPRFAVDGTWNARDIAVWIALRALAHRLRGVRHPYPHQVTA